MPCVFQASCGLEDMALTEALTVLHTSLFFCFVSSVRFCTLPFFSLFCKLENTDLQWHKRQHNYLPHVCLIWEKRNTVFTEGYLVRELNWRWVLVSGLDQNNVHGPENLWDVTPTLWGWVQLLCMSTTDHYICFYLMFCLLIEKQRKNRGFT